ncbi:aldehyde dehydrogenase family protein [Conexibacter sp. JD483]|uniref:aldehyde dehydrogenase family protein n=1 Tax=unclassified Conexibacter TaxID=2627773 RepID=UPI00272811A2|nr:MULTISPECIES: aldehyde dehydrogenase family protein [unclassified Conexibacter]MDO8184924.1 aldehyde dehydrogenase family protein [Conexibacter sp. CPCC 205706]MDO8198068.1 aldehyde dehydrogenase family protein [Conexibacter sp. CPCC 205762]MDR9371357.1 aldehyde dehydrogenase family protein [Conexibacter sp. JD483]
MAVAVSMADATRRFTSEPRKLLIGGEWRDSVSGKTFETYDPATGAVLATVAEGDKQDVELAVAAARKALDGPWAKLNPSERGRIVHRIGDLIMEHAEELAELETLDNGKPKGVALAADVPLAADLFWYMAGWATKLNGGTINPSVPYMPGAEFHAYTLREPVGVVGQIIPWNFPLLMAAWKLGPALTTGCTVVLKPAEQTPLSALRLAELIQEAGVPDGVVNVIPGFGETAGAALAQHPGVDKVAFTGSTEVGKLIAQQATGNLKRVSLELGGKSPNIVFSDADVDAAIAGAAQGIFFNQGEVCSAGSRLYVQEDQFDRVVEGLTSAAQSIRVGHGLDPDTEMGPLVSQEQFDRVTRYLSIGEQEGNRATAGGSAIDGEGWFVQPTVLVDAKPEHTIVQEEVFGPVIAAMPFSDVDDLARQANDSHYGLAAGVWTRDISKAHKLAKRIKAGTVHVNSYHVFSAELPFGGYKQSGWGREMGEEVLNNYMETKSVIVGL